MSNTENEAYSIGEIARLSGLSVSAARFYANNGVLVPAQVNDRTGYRRYAKGQLFDAKLLAALRQAGMPLTESAQLLSNHDSPSAAEEILEGHLRRLQSDTADARRGVDEARELLNLQDVQVATGPTWVDVNGGELAAAISAIKFAVGAKSALPALRGILMEIREEKINLVATDRYRLARASVCAQGFVGAPVAVVVPTYLLEKCTSFLTSGNAVTICVDNDRVCIRFGKQSFSAQCLNHDYPDYRRILPGPGAYRVRLNTSVLRQNLIKGPIHRNRCAQPGQYRHISVLSIHSDQTLTVGSVGDASQGGGVRIGVDRDYLMQAFDALQCDRVVVCADEPVTPLTIRAVDDQRTFSLLMPVHLDDRIQIAG